MINAITYQNTKTELPGWVNTVHVEQPLGYAYETADHFIHLYGKKDPFYIISVGLTAVQKKSGTLKDWVDKIFGAKNIRPMNLPVGHTIEAVWRPCLYYYEDTYKALQVSEEQMRFSEQAIRLLVEKLDDLFVYIEPATSSFNTYSHKTRELLILACTEVENQWKYYMDISGTLPAGKNFTTNDYVKLVDKLHLKEYEFSLKSYNSLSSINPFLNWSSSAPTTSLDWYDAYNKTKHNKTAHFSDATLKHCLSAVVACLVMHCTRFSPLPMYEENNRFASLVMHHFKLKLINPDPTSFYLHEVEIPKGSREDLFVYNARKNNNVLPFVTQKLVL